MKPIAKKTITKDKAFDSTNDAQLRRALKEIIYNMKKFNQALYDFLLSNYF
jgi:hypothetical protein